jgi:endonuclease/exonuclease/phosphatase (EEP) superfamily protein YafD
MDTIISKLLNKGKSIIIAGDLNTDFLGRRVNLQLQTMLNSYSLQAIVDVPTRIGPRIQTDIDQIILNNGLWEYNLKVIETRISDHNVQILQVQMQCKNKKGQVRVEEEYRVTRS